MSGRRRRSDMRRTHREAPVRADRGTPGRPHGRRELRDTLEATILAAAEESFAIDGFEGSSVATIAAAAGLSKQNLMYYFPTKLALYQRVLDDVLRDWLGRMRSLRRPIAVPRKPCRPISAKLEFSRNRPHGSRVFALEIIGGAMTYGKRNSQTTDSGVARRHPGARTLDRGGQGQAGRCRAPVLPDLGSHAGVCGFRPQMLLVLGKRALGNDDFDAAYRTISNLVLNALITGDGKPD